MDWISTDAVVLRTRPAGTLDRMVHLLTPGHGRVVCIAKSARRSLRRFGGCLNTFSEIKAELSTREGREIARLENCVLEEPHEGIRASFDRLRLASAGAELVDRITKGDEETAGLFEEMRQFLRSVSAGMGTRALTRFEIAVLSLSGFRPELSHCVICGRGATGGNVQRIFDVHRGGLVCPSCSRSGERGYLLRISGKARDELIAMLTSAPSEAPASKTVTAECTSVINALVTERLGSPLRSWV